jgi:hypothetical protein
MISGNCTEGCLSFTPAFEGTRQTLFELANRLLRLEKGEIHPYRSRLSQKSPEESDPWQGEGIRAV